MQEAPKQIQFIQSQQNIIAQINGKHYSLTNSKWINRYSNKKKSCNYPSKRYGHSSVTYNHNLYIFGGIQKNKHFQSVKEYVYRLNLNNWGWQKIIVQNHPISRDSFGSCVNQNRMIIFGGSNNDLVFNDLWSFQFQTHIWRELDQKGQKPSQRDLCNLININNQYIILINGMNCKAEVVFDQIYLYCFQTSTWIKMTIINQIKQRIGSAFAKCNQRIYMFGGYQIAKSQNFLNDLYQLIINIEQKTVEYKLIQTESKKPDGRFYHNMIDFSDDYLIVIAGQGVKQEQQQRQEIQALINEVDNELSKQIQKKDEAENEKQEIKIKQTWTRSRDKQIKQTRKQQDEKIQKQKIQKQKKQIQKKQLEKKQLEKKQVEKKKILKEKEEEKKLKLLSIQEQNTEDIKQKNFIPEEINAKKDVWIYHIPTKQWTQIFPKNAQFRPRAGASIAKHQNKILVFGGLRKNNLLFDEFMTLIFVQQKPIPKQLPCQQCIKNEQQQKQFEAIMQLQKQIDYLPTMSNNYLYNIALLQHFAFNAVSLLIDSAILVKSEKVRVAIRKRISDLSYIAVEFAGQSLNNRQFIEFMSNRQSQKNWLNEYSNNIKFGSFRLGRTFLYVDRQKNFIRVALFSVNSNIIPNCEYKYKYFGYIQNIQTGIFLTQNGLQNKRHIINFLSSQIQNPNDLLLETSKHSVYIFEMNLIMTSKNIYYYELITNSPNDIRILINHKKIQFLDDLGYNISQQPDISLRSYLSLLYLNQTIQIYLNQMTIPVEFFNYKVSLQQSLSKHLIQKLELQTPQIKSLQIYRVNQLQEPLQKQHPNFGLLIYQNGRLIMRYGTEFGKLFCDKFYKNKYKTKRFHIFRFLGIIELNSQFLKTNIIKTDLQNNQFAIPFWSKLKNFLKEQRPVMYKAPDTFDEDFVSKKVKVN